MIRWQVKITLKAERDLKNLLQSGKISKSDIHVLKRWLDDMEEFGPAFVANSPEWHDHALGRRWLGFRSSAFSSRGRVIYRVLGSRIVVEVHRVTAEHDYKR